jgi:nicotinamidase-related amidase
VNDALLVVDVVSEFDHEDGPSLLASFRDRLPGLRAALAWSRARDLPVIYVNDQHGRWDGDVAGLVGDAVTGAGGDVASALAPRPGDPFILKPRYSGFDHTPLDLLLEELEVERVLLIGGTTEGCIVQTGIDAREHGLKVTLVTSACTTIDPELEQVALRYAEQVAGMRLVSSLEEASPAPVSSQ